MRWSFAAGTYFVVVDTAAGNAGAFSLSASLSAPACGDEVVAPDEDCDPGPAVANDGCGDPGTPGACLFEPAPMQADDCPGQEVQVPAGTTMLLASDGYSTYGYADNQNSKVGGCPHTGWWKGSSASAGARGERHDDSQDRVRARRGDARLRCGSVGSRDMKLYARTDCGDEGDRTGLLEHVIGITPEVIQFDVTKDVPIYVVVDGYDGWSRQWPI